VIRGHRGHLRNSSRLPRGDSSPSSLGAVGARVVGIEKTRKSRLIPRSAHRGCPSCVAAHAAGRLPRRRIEPFVTRVALFNARPLGRRQRLYPTSPKSSFNMVLSATSAGEPPG
jgi:hypothetical protein